MKNFKMKSILLLVIAFMLFLTGCKVDKTYTVEKYELKDDVYVQEISNDELTVDISDGITINSKSTINFYKDENHKEEVIDTIVELKDGDNFYYAVIEFKDHSTEELKLNLYHLSIFTVKFETNCGTKIPDQHVEENGLITKPDVVLKKYGYGFKGWNYNFNRPVTKDLTVEARWVPNAFTITYDADGGSMKSTETYVTFGEPYELETPVKEGYDFTGWYYNGKLIKDEVWRLDGDITIKAGWEEATETYEIDYVIVGCVGSHLQRTYTNKEEVVLRTPYKCGYRFMGWYYDGDFRGERIYVIPKGTKGNLRLYSRWERFELKNATISILGDSISTFYDPKSDVNSAYHGNNEYYFPIYSKDVKTVQDTWWYQVIDQTQTKLVTNDSISGSTCYNNGSDSNKAAMNYHRINNLKGSEIVIVNIGTNDNVNGYNMEQFKKAYNTMLARIKEVCPDVYVFCCTLGYSAYQKYDYTEERRIAMNDIIRQAVIDNDCALLEIDTIQTKDTYQTILGDALHPCKAGMKILSDYITRSIKDYVDARF